MLIIKLLKQKIRKNKPFYSPPLKSTKRALTAYEFCQKILILSLYMYISSCLNYIKAPVLHFS